MLTGLVAGCQQTSFSQTHYVGVLNTKTGDAQFYKFSIKGDPGWNSMQYVSGWYDREAIEGVVGERLSAAFSVNLVGEGPSTSNPESYVVAGPHGHTEYLNDKQFAIIMAADPQPIIDGIAKIVENAALLKTIKREGTARSRQRLVFAKALVQFVPDANIKAMLEALIAAEEQRSGGGSGEKGGEGSSTDGGQS